MKDIMQKSYSVIIYLCVVPLLASCGLKYSPFMNPAAEPLPAHTGEVTGAFSMLPETGSLVSSTSGVELGAKYAFSEKLTLQVRLWSEVDQLSEMNLDGYSFDGVYMLSDSTSPVRIGIMPKVAFLMNGRRVDAHAEYLGGIAWLPDWWLLHPYIGIGGGVGNYLERDAGETEDREYWGMVFTANAGAGINIFDDLRFNVELASVFVSDRYNEDDYWYPLLPSFSLAWQF